MPDYSQPYWQEHPGEDYANNIARGRQMHSQDQQRQFENARQTSADQNDYAQQALINNRVAQEAADKYIKQRDYAAGIDALQKQFPNGGPDFDRGMALLALKTTGPTPGAATQFARGIEAPTKPPAPASWMPQPAVVPPAMIGVPPSAPSGIPNLTAPPIGTPGTPTAPAAPASPAGTAAFAPPGLVWNGRQFVRDPSYVRPTAPIAPPSAVPIPGGGGRIVSGGGLPGSRIMLDRPPATSPQATAALVAKRDVLLAERKQAVAALNQAAKDKSARGVGQANADIARIDGELRNFGTPEGQSTPAAPDSQPPVQAPLPMPKTKAELKKGTLYQTSGGPGIWNGETFDLQ